jgi:D-beta-D-heptose 7-phosphate kinase/D-beta-D-heptose 1-phosphate adenosyltransferase
MKVLVIGDSCIDRYRYGTCERISPEAPVPILNFCNFEDKKGMAANVAENLISLNLNVNLFTNKEQIIKERFIESKSMQQLLRVDYENLPIKEAKIENINLDDYSAIVISDYNKGFLQKNSIQDIIKINNNKKPIFVDSKKKDLSFYENCIIKINKLENSLVHKWPNNYTKIVTIGSNGAIYNNKIFKSKKVEVFDVCGAGDSFLSGLVYGYLKNEGNIEKSIEIANLVASISTKHYGNYSVKETEINE